MAVVCISCSVAGFAAYAYCYITFRLVQCGSEFLRRKNVEIIFSRVEKTCNFLNIYQTFGVNLLRPSQGQNSICKKAACSIETSVYICVCTLLHIHCQKL